jgi:hypothetical protein
MAKSFDLFSFEARSARRQERLDGMSSLKGSMKKASRSDGITTQNAGVQAVLMARQLLDGYHLTSQPKLSYSGLRGGKVASHSSKVEEGVVTVHASMQTASSINVAFDIPMEIVAGEILEPSVLIYNGFARIMAQSTFDDIISNNTLKETLPVRDMYSAPLDNRQSKDAYANRVEVSRVNRGMFSLSAVQEELKKAIRGQSVDITKMAQTVDVIDIMSGIGGKYFIVVFSDGSYAELINGILIPEDSSIEEIDVMTSDDPHAIALREYGNDVNQVHPPTSESELDTPHRVVDEEYDKEQEPRGELSLGEMWLDDKQAQKDPDDEASWYQPSGTMDPKQDKPKVDPDAPLETGEIKEKAWQPVEHRAPPGYTETQLKNVRDGGTFILENEHWRKFPSGVRRQKGRAPKTPRQVDPETKVFSTLPDIMKNIQGPSMVDKMTAPGFADKVPAKADPKLLDVFKDEGMEFDDKKGAKTAIDAETLRRITDLAGGDQEIADQIIREQLADEAAGTQLDPRLQQEDNTQKVFYTSDDTTQRVDPSEYSTQPGMPNLDPTSVQREPKTKPSETQQIRTPGDEDSTRIAPPVASRDAKVIPRSPRPPNTPGVIRAPKLKRKPDIKKLCNKCNHAPCVCPGRRKSVYHTITAQVHESSTDLIAKVNKEIEQMQSDGLQDIDIRLAISGKYPSDVVQAVFKKVAPE